MFVRELRAGPVRALRHQTSLFENQEKCLVRQARGIAICDRCLQCVLGLSISFVLEQLVRSRQVGLAVGAAQK